MKPSADSTLVTRVPSPCGLLLGATLFITSALQSALAASPGSSEVMQGFPPAAEMRVNKANAFLPPYLRWSMRHAREVSPTRNIPRSESPLPLKIGPGRDLGSLTFAAGDEALTLDDQDLLINWHFTDLDEDYALTLRNGVLTHRTNARHAQPDVDVSMTKALLDRIALKETGFLKESTIGGIEIEGGRMKLLKLLGGLDEANPQFNLVTP